MRRSVAALAVLLAVACGRDGRVGPGDAVTLHYELTVDGSVRESTYGGEPVEIVQGRGDVPPGADAALIGMRPGDEKNLTLTPSSAFGERDASLVRTSALKSFGALGRELKVGKKISGFRNGKAESGVVLSVDGGGGSDRLQSPAGRKDGGLPSARGFRASMTGPKDPWPGRRSGATLGT
ncbi:MAG: peptidylprolyl isomerase [Elusimicrobiota bacterium]